jgi:hypothetical protein
MYLHVYYFTHKGQTEFVANCPRKHTHTHTQTKSAPTTNKQLVAEWLFHLGQVKTSNS